ncbi:hypothetical protein BBJ28_00022441 [Nothophytophthora sp. Chile5]|nr:hypothetical protein BBJ28_00022441 [Nothophytophthora sp. Chile5]
MQATLPWSIITSGISKEDAATLLDTFKSFKIAKSDLAPCNICASPTPHNMRRRVLICKSMACAEATPYARCSRRGRTLSCLLLNLVSISETARFRNAFLNRFELNEQNMSPLAAIQRFTQHVARTQLGGSDDYEEIRAQVIEMAYSLSQPEGDPFTFTWDTDTDGAPQVGSGSDADPFIVGVTPKRLLQRANRDPGSFILHADAIFKLNQVRYPVFVVGISGLARSFHLVALFVTSQRRQPDYINMLSALRKVFNRVTGNHMVIRHAMAGADDAQWSAAQAVFGVSVLNYEFKGLTCFYHVMAKVYEKTLSLRPPLATLVLSGVNDMHFSFNEAEFVKTKTRILAV